eukprot:s4193_g3.t1
MYPFFAYLGCLFAVIQTGRNPVPIPGVTSATMSTNEMTLFHQTQLDDYFHHFAGHKGEGCRGATTTTGATEAQTQFLDLFAKSGNPPPLGSGPNSGPPAHGYTKIQKRSFHRACRRASYHGATWYKGQLRTPDDFPQSLRDRLSAVPTPQVTRRFAGNSQHPAKRFSLLQWNPGGLSSCSFHELRLWLRHNPVDIVVLCETRWSFSTTWADQRWAYLHTASPEPRSGGILVMIARHLIHPEHIGFDELSPGRCMHIRLHFVTRHLDLVAVYQHVDTHQAPQKLRRRQLWQLLDRTLGSLPQRNQLICTGDFNTALPGTAPWLGTSYFHFNGKRQLGSQHADMSDFFQILKQHSLTALNGWNASLGKLVVGLLAAKLKDFLTPELSRFPQFGFLPLRAATDAIARVAKHCREVRALVSAQRRSVQAQMQRTPAYRICGGIQLFLDLTRAFDCVHRLMLFQHLHDLHTPADLLQIISSWHTNTHYNLIFQGVTTKIPVGVGLRQGCKIAPILWVVFMDKFLKMLIPLTGAAWLSRALTLYADDIHAGCIFHSELELSQALQNFGHMLDVLEAMQLQLSYHKSFMLLAVAGSNHRRSTKGHLTRGPQGHQILLPRQDGSTTALPLRSKGRYLGVVMSYNMFEEATWQLRRQAGWGAFNRLKPWFTSRAIDTSAKLRLWHSSVYTILHYGLFSAGITVKLLHDFQSTLFRMLRILLGDHAFVTHHTHQQALKFHNIADPLQLLLGSAMGLWHRLGRRTTMLHTTDFLRTVDWTHLPDLIRLIREFHTVQPEVWNPARDALPHSDACSHCGAIFESRDGLRRHILDNRCSSFNPDAPSTQLDVVGKWHHVLQLCNLTRQGLTARERQELTLACQFCGVTYSRTGDLIQHLQQSHSDVWLQSLPLVRYLLQTVTAKHGCLCNPMAHGQGQTHVCACLRQLSMAHVLSSNALLIPTQFSQQFLMHQFPAVCAHDTMTHIVDILTHRHFDKLWQHPEILQFLRGHCLLCGGAYHPATLIQHLHSWHLQEVLWATQLIFQLEPCLAKLQPQDYHCMFCGLVFNLPPTDSLQKDDSDRQELMQIHFTSNCPVLLQLGLLLQPLLPREDVSHGPARSGTPAEPGSSRPADGEGGQVPKRRRRGSTAQTSQAGGGCRDAAARQPDPTESGRTAPTSFGIAAYFDTSGSATRAATPATSAAGLLHTVCPGGSPGSSALAGHIGGRMESSEVEEPLQPDIVHIEDSSVQGSPERTSSPPDPVVPQQSGGGTVGPCPLQGDHPRGRELAYPTLESRGEMHETGPQSPSANGEGTERGPIHARPHGRSGPCDQVPLIDPPGQDGAVVLANVPPAGRSLADIGGFGAVHTLGPDGNIPQNPQPKSEQAGIYATADDDQANADQQEGNGQRPQVEVPCREMTPERPAERLRAAVLSLVFANSGSLCYANSASHSFGHVSAEHLLRYQIGVIFPSSFKPCCLIQMHGP